MNNKKYKNKKIPLKNKFYYFMNLAIKIILKTLMTKISHISWGDYDKGFYGNKAV